MTEDRAVKASIIRLTPQLATDLLKQNTHNRGIVQSRVAQYSADMRRGNWMINGEAIKIAKGGQILDGQHRILAVLDSDTTIETLVITGLEPEAQETMDQGRPRQLCDALKLRGELEYFALAAAVRIIATYEQHGTLFPDSFRRPPTIHESMKTLDRNPEIRDSIKFASKDKVRWAPYSSLAALHFLFTSVDEDDANDFITKLVRGENLTAASPIWVLREYLIREHADYSHSLSYKTKMAFIIRTWNAYRSGEESVRLTWKGGSHPDPFPRINGLQGKAGEVQEVNEAIRE